MMTFRVRLKKTKKPTRSRLRFDLEKLRKPDVAGTFQATIGGKGLRALRPFFGPHMRSKYESGNNSISMTNISSVSFRFQWILLCSKSEKLAAETDKEFVIFRQVLDIQLTN